MKVDIKKPLRERATDNPCEIVCVDVVREATYYLIVAGAGGGKYLVEDEPGDVWVRQRDLDSVVENVPAAVTMYYGVYRTQNGDIHNTPLFGAEETAEQWMAARKNGIYFSITDTLGTYKVEIEL